MCIHTYAYVYIHNTTSNTVDVVSVLLRRFSLDTSSYPISPTKTNVKVAS